MRVLQAIAFVIATACASAPEVVHKNSASQPPKWVVVPPQDGQFFYFVGAKSGAASLDEGKAGALAAALAQASQFIGVKIVAEGSYTQSTEDAENRARSDVHTSTGGQLRSAQIADVYFESMSRVVASGEIDRFDVWVLAKLPKAEAQAERDRQAKEKAAHVEAALGHFEQGRATHDAKLAVFHFREAKRELAAVDDAVDLNRSGFATSRDLSGALDLALSASVGAQRRTAIVFTETSLGQHSADAVSAGRISEILAGRGFSVMPPLEGDAGNVAVATALAKQSGARIALLVTASAARTGTVFGTQAAVTATVQVRAIDAQSGEVLAQSDKQGRGIKGDANVAAHEALKQAGEQAAGELAQALLSREGN